jgi:tetratricopeptide (TPR) repeat protein
VPDRQQTLRATLDWSHDLLGDEERSLFAELGVFRAPATLPAIEEVCRAGPTPVDEALAGLLDKGLVHPVDGTHEDEPRFGMHEPILAYARERLSAVPDATSVHTRHLQRLASLGRRAQPFLCGPRQRDWLHRFDGERADLRSAMEFGLASGRLDVVLRLAWDTLVYFYVRDAVDDLRGWLTRLDAERERLDETQQVLLDVALVIVGVELGERDATAALAAAVAHIDATAALPLESAVSRHYLGLAQWQDGDGAAATRSLEAALGRYDAIDHDWGVATLSATLGAVLMSGGDTAGARAQYDTALDRAERIGNRPLVAHALHGLGLVAASAGDPDGAAVTLARAVSIVLEDRSVTGATYCLHGLAAIAVAEGRPAEALRLVATADAVRRRFSIPEWMLAEEAVRPMIDAARRSSAGGDLPAPAADPDVDVFATLEAAMDAVGG